MRVIRLKPSLFNCFITLIVVSMFVLVFIVYDLKLSIYSWTDYLTATDFNNYNDFSLDTIIERRAPARYAIISTSLTDKTKFYYLLYLPICAIAWRRIGYEPLVLIVSNPIEKVSPVANKTIEYLVKFRIRIINVLAPLEYTDQLGMLARIYGGALSDDIIKDEDHIFISDSDLIPVSNSYFNLLNTNAITILNAFNIGSVEHKGKRYEMFPMAYIGMRKWQWREVMNLSKGMAFTGENILNQVRQLHGESVIRKNSDVRRGDDVWYLDQKTITILINEYVSDPNYKSERKLNRFGFTGLRLDRADTKYRWYQKLNSFTRLIDCHMYHADSRQKIKLIVDFLERLFNKNICDKIKTYFHEFFSLLSK